MIIAKYFTATKPKAWNLGHFSEWVRKYCFPDWTELRRERFRFKAEFLTQLRNIAAKGYPAHKERADKLITEVRVGFRLVTVFCSPSSTPGLL